MCQEVLHKARGGVIQAILETLDPISDLWPYYQQFWSDIAITH